MSEKNNNKATSSSYWSWRLVLYCGVVLPATIIFLYKVRINSPRRVNLAPGIGVPILLICIYKITVSVRGIFDCLMTKISTPYLLHATTLKEVGLEDACNTKRKRKQSRKNRKRKKRRSAR